MIVLPFRTDPALLPVALAAILLNGASASSAFRGELRALNTQLALAAPASRVVSVEMQGKQKIGKHAILQTVATRPGPEFSREQLDRDDGQIRQMGWFRAEPAARAEETPGGVKVTFIVREWPIVQRLEINGNRALSTDALRAVIQTREIARGIYYIRVDDPSQARQAFQ